MKIDIVPAYVLRAYIWALLKANTEMDELDYKNSENPSGLIPIVPVAEEPELSEFNKPYIVYGWAHNATGDLPEYKSGSMTLVVYSTNFHEISNILALLQVAFDKMDESAKNVNNYSSTIPAFRGIRFGEISLGFAEGGTPEANNQDTAQTEGGRQSGIITLRFECFIEHGPGVVKQFQPTGNETGQVTGGTWA